MAENVNEKLFSEFAPNTTQEWKDKVIADLKGARPRQRPTEWP